jgi:hypothetical protein
MTIRFGSGFLRGSNVPAQNQHCPHAERKQTRSFELGHVHGAIIGQWIVRHSRLPLQESRDEDDSINKGIVEASVERLDSEAAKRRIKVKTLKTTRPRSRCFSASLTRGTYISTRRFEMLPNRIQEHLHPSTRGQLLHTANESSQPWIEITSRSSPCHKQRNHPAEAYHVDAGRKHVFGSLYHPNRSSQARC